VNIFQRFVSQDMDRQYSKPKFDLDIDKKHLHYFILKDKSIILKDAE